MHEVCSHSIEFTRGKIEQEQRNVISSLHERKETPRTTSNLGEVEVCDTRERW